MARKTLPGEMGTFNPYTREYEHAGTVEENQEDFQKEHLGERNVDFEMAGQEQKTGQKLPPSEQPETYNPHTGRWEKAGYPEEEK